MVFVEPSLLGPTRNLQVAIRLLSRAVNGENEKVLVALACRVLYLGDQRFDHVDEYFGGTSGFPVRGKLGGSHVVRAVYPVAQVDSVYMIHLICLSRVI